MGTSDPEPVIEAKGLVKRYARRDVLPGVSLTVRPGEACMLLGPNGAGKSTLLRVLATLERPESGTLRIAGVDALVNGARARRAVGVVGHEPGFYPSLTLRENMELAAGFARVDAREGASRIDDVLDAFGLARLTDERAGRLSRGTRQRAALARAFLHRPAVLLLDEPWTGLDDDASRALDRAVADALRRGAAVVASTHEADRAIGAATRVLRLDGGRVLDVEAARP